MNKVSEIDDLDGELQGLESAEEFLEYFNIEFDPRVLQVSRLHILQRFHDYLKSYRIVGERPGYAEYHLALARAYDDFVRSDAVTEKVFRVFKRAAGIATVPVSAIGRARS